MWDTAGNIVVSRSFQMESLSNYVGEWSALQWLVDTVFFSLWLVDIAREVHKIRVSIRRERFSVYISSLSTYLTWGHETIILVTLGWWFWLINSTRALSTPANLSVMSDPIHGPSGPRPFLTDPQKEKDFLDFYDNVRNICWSARMVWALECFTLWAFVVRMIVILDFQPRLALITRTLMESGKDMSHFFVLFIFLLVSYGFVGKQLFGAKISDFSTLSSACSFLVEIFMGWVDNYLPFVAAIRSYRSNFTTGVFIIYW